MTVFALFGLAFALAVTIVIELLVALAFRVGGRGLLAVALVSVVTNPVLNLVVGYFQEVTSVDHPALAGGLLWIAEALVVFVEWRLLVWALRSTAGSPLRLLGLAVTMNVASAVGFTFATGVIDMVVQGFLGLFYPWSMWAP